jgi:STE20-related kinase adapter protein alpha
MVPNSIDKQEDDKNDNAESTNRTENSNPEPNTASYYQRIQRLDHDCFIACDKLTKKQLYALRIYQLEQLDDIDFKLLINDLKLCKQLKHPNIIKNLYNFIHQDQLWVVQKFCSFTSADTLSKPFGLPELAIAFIIKDTLLALEYLHQQNLIHRSVRASHILVKSDGRCLLSGLKYSVNTISDGKKLFYMHQYPQKARPNIYWFSPEILEQNLFGYNYKSDIYSLGITCCELANGIVPFSDLQPTEMLLDKLTGNAPRLLDSTCQELIQLRPNEMSPEDRDKFYVFRGRQFSSAFHNFTSGLCLNFDPHKRPEAKKLLGHSFIKQLRKSPATNLLDFLDPSLQKTPNLTHLE